MRFDSMFSDGRRVGRDISDYDLARAAVQIDELAARGLGIDGMPLQRGQVGCRLSAEAETFAAGGPEALQEQIDRLRAQINRLRAQSEGSALEKEILRAYLRAAVTMLARTGFGEENGPDGR